MLYIIIHKKEGNLPFATSWINLDIMLSEISQIKKDEYCMISPVWGIFLETQRREEGKSGFQGLRWGLEEEVDRLVKGCKLSVIRWIMHNMVTIVNNAILYTLNLLWVDF